MTMQIGGTSGLVFPDSSTQNTAATGFGFKNRIINGAMMIDQRNAGASVTGDGAYPVDRWKASSAGGGAFSMQQSSTAPAGFVNSVVCTVTTADSSIASTDEYSYRQFVEGLNMADLGWGTANAQTVTLSFWVRSSITGTYAVGFRNSASNRSYPATYTISSANTWEYKSVTVPGDTTGTWLTTNGVGVGVIFSLGAGSSLQGTANTWNAANVWATSTSTQWIATNGATFYITGVQLEKGSTATSFDYRPYGTELQLCERYFQKCDTWNGCGNSSTTWVGVFPTRTTMRASPSVSGTGPVYVSNYYSTDALQSSFSSSPLNQGGGGTSVCCFLYNYTGLTPAAYYGGSRAINSNYITLSSEL